MDVQDYLRRINVKNYKRDFDFFCALNKSTEDKESLQRVIEIISNRADSDTNEDIYKHHSIIDNVLRFCICNGERKFNIL